MIDVICVTNLDDYKKEKWPDRFCCRPLEGDIVQSNSGRILKIVRIRHIIDMLGNPKLRCELHKTV